MNHPFEQWKRLALSDWNKWVIVDSLAAKCFANRCDGASLMEVGFP